ncbi:MAG TPA: hypothetical protein PLN86_06995 [Candidatus Hydrogenedentes bacterium]|nr:hypothetical protein [Candidatus Hydrogenedentota bacterium]
MRKNEKTFFDQEKENSSYKCECQVHLDAGPNRIKKFPLALTGMTQILPKGNNKAQNQKENQSPNYSPFPGSYR